MKKGLLAWMLAIACVVGAMPFWEISTVAATGEFLGGQVEVRCLYPTTCDYPSAASPTQLASLEEVMADVGAHTSANTTHMASVAINSGTHSFGNTVPSRVALSMYGGNLTNSGSIPSLAIYDGTLSNNGTVDNLSIGSIQGAEYVALSGSYATTTVRLSTGTLDLSGVIGSLNTLIISGASSTLVVGGTGQPSTLTEALDRIYQHVGTLQFSKPGSNSPTLYTTLMDTSGSVLGIIANPEGPMQWTPHTSAQKFVATDKSGAPVSGAYIMITGGNTMYPYVKTDGAGEAFVALPAGQYSFYVYHWGQKLSKLLENIAVTSGQTLPITVDDGCLVTVKAHKNGQVVPISCVLELGNTGITYASYPNNDGSAYFDMAPRGTHTLSVYQSDGSGILLYKRTITITGDTDIDTDLTNAPPPTTVTPPVIHVGGSDSGGDSGSGITATADRQAKSKVELLVDGYTFTVKADGPTARGLQQVTIDGNAVTDYTVRSGSVIVTLKDSLVQTLKPGSHTIRLEFLNHIAEAQFTVDTTGVDSSSATGSDAEASGTAQSNTNANPSTGR